MDGTLLDSHKAFERTWSRWAQSNGVGYAEAAAAMHGARAAEIIRRFAPSCSDPEEEARAIEESEMSDLPGIAEIAGARSFLAKLPDGR
jgi:mannitol-1-/sugar-/sorbitol-6-phosphatase